MRFNCVNSLALSSGLLLAISAISLNAAEQPTIGSSHVEVSFMGGYTMNEGASFHANVPPTKPFDFVSTIIPSPAHVGQAGSLFALASADGFGSLNLSPQGQWVGFDEANLLAFSKKTLSASEPANLIDNLVANDVGANGVTLDIRVGYYLDSAPATWYISDPISVRINENPVGCPEGTTENPNQAMFEGKEICDIEAKRYLNDLHLTDNKVYNIKGTIFIGENTVNTPIENKISLTIDPGVKLFADGNQTAIVIDRGGMIFANGTPARPVIMTSQQDNGALDALNQRGLWGGLIINGSATQNTSSGFSDGEGGTGQYGGGESPNDNDHSGHVTYLQIRYAGFPITSDDELNTLSLQGVGRRTVLDYIHSHNGADDGIEFYGGTVNAKHILITGQQDDALDWTNGWTGNIQHVIIQHTNKGDNCIEADNLGSLPTATPRSNPIVSNLTCITSLQQLSNGHAFELKAGTGMQMYNSVIGGMLDSTEGCIRIAGEATFVQSVTSGSFNGSLRMDNSLITDECAADLSEGPGSTFTTADWFAAQNSSAGIVDLGGPEGWTNGAAINSEMPEDLSAKNSFFDAVDYIGAVKDEASDWTIGWSFDYD
ncbi:MAG: hypothetical protein OXD01_10320 [Gammaproteobacteria bacterium]|nr:hypothetical protein [Gammaproteobacteria bacterium]